MYMGEVLVHGHFWLWAVILRIRRGKQSGGHRACHFGLSSCLPLGEEPLFTFTSAPAQPPALLVYYPTTAALSELRMLILLRSWLLLKSLKRVLPNQNTKHEESLDPSSLLLNNSLASVPLSAGGMLI